MEDALIGKNLGHCRVQRRVGMGGMGTVYRGEHTGLNKPVAIKVLSHVLATDAAFIKRFFREARLAAKLEHPNVVQVFDVGQEGDVYYISMQFIEGKTVDDVLKERKKLSLSEAVSITKRVASALAAAHKLGIVHRDIKPANILISKDGVVKVADFGLAKDDDANRSVSSTDQVIGTPYYMSPEQADSRPVDARSDLYSLGATFYHMLTGRRVFEGGTPLSIMVKHVKEDPISPKKFDPSIPDGVCRILSKMMAKNPAARYMSAEDLIRDLDALKSTSISMKGAPPARPRKKWAIPAAAAALVVAGIVVGVALTKDSGPRPVAAAPQPPPAPLPTPPPPEDPRQKILAKFSNPVEKKHAEDLMNRVDELMRAVQKKEEKGPGEMAGEIFQRSVMGERKMPNAELEGWEIKDVQIQLRPSGSFQPTQGVTTLELSIKHAKGSDLSTRDIHWVRKPEGWHFIPPRLPKPADK